MNTYLFGNYSCINRYRLHIFLALIKKYLIQLWANFLLVNLCLLIPIFIKQMSLFSNHKIYKMIQNHKLVYGSRGSGRINQAEKFLI